MPVSLVMPGLRYARVYDNACVYGNARVSGDACVYGDAHVFGDACVFGNARVSGDACVFGNARVSVTPPRASRSDCRDFIVVPDSSGVLRVIAGCRYFTFEEARDHWTRTRAGTPLGEETMDILDYLEMRAKKVYTKLDIPPESC
jgi:hypothetical protein